MGEACAQEWGMTGCGAFTVDPPPSLWDAVLFELGGSQPDALAQGVLAQETGVICLLCLPSLGGGKGLGTGMEQEGKRQSIKSMGRAPIRSIVKTLALFQLGGSRRGVDGEGGIEKSSKF